MRGIFLLRCLAGAALVAGALTLPGISPAEAGQTKFYVYGSSDGGARNWHGSVRGHRIYGRHGRFARFQKPLRMARRYRHKRRRFHRSYAYGAYGAYGAYVPYYDNVPNVVFIDDTVVGPTYDDTAEPAPAYQDKLVVPKWIHIVSPENPENPAAGDGQLADNGLRENCLSAKTQIMVDNQPIEAVGRACLQADGTWRLLPAE